LLTFFVQGVWLRPLDPTIFRIGFLQIGFFVTLAAVIAVVACSRIERFANWASTCYRSAARWRIFC
jgi:hypothetical protein